MLAPPVTDETPAWCRGLFMEKNGTSKAIGAAVKGCAKNIEK